MEQLISIITPNFNCDQFIERTIESVQSQTYKNWEWIIVDDGSTDNSVNIIEAHCKLDSRICLIKSEVNRGPAKSRNAGIERCRGNFIAFLDSDDYWHFEKLEKQINFMTDGDYPFSFTSYFSINENGKNKKLIKATKKVNYNGLLKDNSVGCLTVMYSVSKLGKVFFPDLKKRQDWALWLKLLKRIEYFHGLQIPLAYYTIRKSSVSSNKIELIRYNWIVYRKFEKLKFIKSLYFIFILVFKKLLKWKYF